jgi:hypothetical protein
MTLSEDVDSQERSYKLCRVPLNNIDTEPEIIEEGKGIDGGASNILCYGNNVYYLVSKFTDTTMEAYVCSIKRFNIQTKAVDTFISDPGAIGGFTIFNGKFIYPVPGKGTYACDLDGTNPIKIFDEYGINLPGEDMLYIDNLNEFMMHKADRKLTVMDKDWQVVRTVSLKGIGEPPLGCANDNYFVPDSSQFNDFGTIHTIYRVSPDDTEPELFFHFVPKVPDNGVTYEGP